MPTFVQFEEVFNHTKDLFLEILFRNNRSFSFENVTFSRDKQLESNTKKIFCLLLEKVTFSSEKLRLFGISIFKNRSFPYGQKLLQIGPNSAWSVPGVPRV